MQSFRQGNFDQFKFSMPLSSYKNIINIEMVIKYEVGYPSQIYWDNNNGLNYHLTIKALPSTISRKNSVPEFEDLVNRLVNMKRESKKYEDDLDDQDDSDTLSITPRLKSSFNRYNFNNSEQELPKRPALKTSFSNSDVGNVKPRYSNSYKARQQKGLDNDSTSSNVSHISASSTNLALSQDTNFNSKSYSDLIASMCFYQGDSTTPKSNSSSSSTNLHCKIEQEPSFQNIPIGSRLSSASTFHSFSDSIHI